MAKPYRWGDPTPESVQRLQARRAKRAEIAFWLLQEEVLLATRSVMPLALCGEQQAISRGTPDELCAAGFPASLSPDLPGSVLQQSAQLLPSMCR